MKKSVTLSTLLFIVLLAGCKKDSVLPPEDLGFAYFPVNTGHWVTYQVDSTYWDDFTGSVYYYHYQIKEIIESEFTDNEGRNTLRIERYKRAGDTCDWAIKDVWYANLTSSTAERVEENVRFVKLVFPVRDAKEWNGNAYNSLGEEDYTYEQVDTEYSAGVFTFDSTATVKIRDLPGTIIRKYSAEIYAKHVGMIYKKFTDIYDPPSGNKRGTDYSYTVIGWGD